MRTPQLLATLRQRGVELWTEGTELRFRAPPDALSADLLAEMRAQKTAIREFLDRAHRPAERSRVIKVQTQGAGTPLFFMHEECTTLLPCFGAARPVYAVGNIVEHDILAWSRGEPVTRSFEELATRFVGEMRAVQPHGPYFLAGYCLYAVLALEVANQLRRQGELIGGLFVLDAHYRPGVKRTLLERAARWTNRLRFYLVENHGALKRLLYRQHELKRLRRELPPSDLAYLNRIHFWSQLAQGYRSAPYDGRVVLMRAMNPHYPDPFGIRRDGWDRLLTGEVHLEDFACGHDDIVLDPYAKDLADRMERHMARVDVERVAPAKPMARAPLNAVTYANDSTRSGDLGSAPVPA